MPVKKDSSDHEKRGQDSLCVIATGSSAGGLEALKEFLVNLPDSLGNIAVIVAQHVSPAHKSMLVELLSRETKLEVAAAVDGENIEANKVYITPPDKEISVLKGQLILTKPPDNVNPKPGVDVLFHSLANEQESVRNVIGIILSGTGSDGASGVKALKDAGGFIIVQEPHTARYDGMPVAAMKTEAVDAVLSPDKMGEEIAEYLKKPDEFRMQKKLENNEGNSLDRIFKRLSKRTGIDFSNYKRATIGRRLQKHLAMHKIHSIDEYLNYVEGNPEELDEMFRTVLIGVTSFFRDEEAFEALERHLKAIIDAKTSDDPVRIWVPGCSTGEEAYSITILLTRILQSRAKNYEIEIFATDIDEKALSTARKGVYPQHAVENVPKKTLETWFVKNENGYEVVKPIRSKVLFSKHDLIGNPPFLNLDLISCRNLLIYFGAALQQRIFPVFHYALNPDGILFLGKSETTGQFTDLFSVIDGENKLFKRKRNRNLNPINFSAFKAQKSAIYDRKPGPDKKPLSVTEQVKETLFNTYEHPYVVIDDVYNIRETYGDVRPFLSLPAGAMQANLLKMVNKEIQIEVRTVVSKAVKNRDTIKSRIKRFELYEKDYFVRITAKPLIYTRQTEDLFVVIFEQLDIGGFVIKKAAGDEEPGTEAPDERIRELEHELAATREHLQTYIEEIETSNEELEEKEALLNQKEQNQKALLNNTLQAFFLVDQSYKIIAYNHSAEQLMKELGSGKLRKGDSIVDITSSHNLGGLVDDIKEAFDGETISGERKERTQSGADRWFAYNITPVFNEHREADVISIGMIDITAEKEFSVKLNSAERLLFSVFDAATSGICITDETGRYVDVNSEYCRIYGYEREELTGRNITMMVPPESRESVQKLHDDFIAGKDEPDAEWEVQKKDGSQINIFSSARLLEYEDGSRFKVTSIKDLTENKKYRDLLHETQTTGSIGGWELDTINHTLSWTEEVYNIFELPADAEVDFERMLKQFPQEAGVVLKEAFNESLENGSPFDIELECTTSSDEKKWVRITSNPVRVHKKTVKVYGTIQDISARIDTERSLRLALNMLHERNKEQTCLYNISKLNEVSLSLDELIEKSLEILPQGFEHPEETYAAIHFDGKTCESGGFMDSGAKLTAESNRGHEKTLTLEVVIPDGENKNNSLFPEKEQVLLDTVADLLSLKFYQKEARVELEESNERLEFVIKATEDLIYDHDLTEDHIKVRENFEKKFGHEIPGETFSTETWSELVHPDDRSACNMEFENALKDPSVNKWDAEYRFLKKDGSYANVFENGYILRDHKGKAIRIIGAIRDITEQKVLEDLLDQTNRLAKIGSWEVDLIKNRMYWSGITREIHEVGPDFQPELDSGIHFYKEGKSREKISEAVKNAIEKGEGWDEELQIITAKGNERWVRAIGEAERADGKSVRLYGSFQDIDQRKSSEIALQKLFDGKNEILESIGDAFFAVNRDWTVTYWNHMAEVVLGMPREKIVGKNLWDLYEDATSLDFYTQYHKAVSDQVTVHFEEYYPFLGKWFEVSAYPSSTGLSVYFKDISERKRNQKKILEKTQQLDAIALFNGLIIKKDDWLEALDECLGVFGEVIDADRVYYFENDLSGQPGEETTSIKIEWVREGIKPEIENPMHDKIQFNDIRSFIDPLSEKKPFNKIVKEITDKDFQQLLLGQEIQSLLALPVFTDKKFRGFIGFDDCSKERAWSDEEISFLQTISINLASAIENEDAEIALQHAFDEKNTILESIGDGFFTVDNNFTVSYWNSQAEELLFTPKEKVLGKHLWDIFDKEKATTSYQKYRRALNEHISLKFEDYYDPIQKWFDVNVYPSGNGISVFFKDITKRKQDEEQLKELNRTLEQQARELAASNEELEQFAFVASHDLQEPLRMISSFLAQLERKYDSVLDEKGRKYIHFATDGARRMRQIILDLLDFSRVGRIDLERKEADVGKIVESVVLLHQKMIQEKKAVVEYSGLPVIFAAEIPLQQLFQNLVNNALKYHEGNKPPRVVISSAESEKYWAFSVEDNGIGIHEEYQEKIFTIFQRLHHKDEYSGTGVGLAICKKIAEQHGGEIWVESEPGEGSTFYFTISK